MIAVITSGTAVAAPGATVETTTQTRTSAECAAAIRETFGNGQEADSYVTEYCDVTTTVSVSAPEEVLSTSDLGDLSSLTEEEQESLSAAVADGQVRSRYYNLRWNYGVDQQSQSGTFYGWN